MRTNTLTFSIPVTLLLLMTGAAARGAAGGVHDDAHFFTPGGIVQANAVIQQIEQKHQRDLLVETFNEIPEDQQAQLQQEGADKFFRDWADKNAVAQHVHGVYVIICKSPTHLQAVVDNTTRKGLFTLADRDTMARQLLGSFKQKDYDGGLIQAARFVQQTMDANASSANTPPPAGASPQSNYPSTPRSNYPAVPSPRGDTNWGLGGLACVVVGVILLIILFRGIFGRRTGGGYPGGGGGYYPPAGGGIMGQGGYPQQGGIGYGGGGGGGGFGRGFLGGLLGGAVGGYAADRYMHPGQGGSVTPPAPGGGGGGDFGSGDSGGAAGTDFGFSDSGSGGGGDFGGGGGGGDSGGGGGGDSGGGGGGGDF